MEFMFSAKEDALDPEIFEEMTLLRAQTAIGQAMKMHGISKSELARKLGKSRSAVTRLLSDGRNLTLKSLGHILYVLGEEVLIQTQPISDHFKDDEEVSQRFRVVSKNESEWVKVDPGNTDFREVA